MTVMSEKEKMNLADQSRSSFICFLQNHAIGELDSIKDLLLKKASSFGTNGLSIDWEFIKAVYYDEEDLTDIAFDMLETYCNQAYKHQLSLRSLASENAGMNDNRTGIFYLMLNPDTVLNSPYNEEDYSLSYEGLIRLILDIYVPSDYPNDVVQFFIDEVSISDIMSNLHNNKFIQDKIDGIQFRGESATDTFLVFKHLSDIYCNRDTKINAFVDIFMEYKTVYSRVDSIQNIIGRFESNIGDDTGSLTMDLIISLKNESTEYSEKIVDDFLFNLNENYSESEKVHKIFTKDLIKYISSINPDLKTAMLMNFVDAFNPNEEPATESFICYLDPSLKGLDLAIAREASTKTSQKMHDGSRKIYSAYKTYKNAEDKVDSQVTKAAQGIKGVLTGDVRSEIIEGKKFSAISLFKRLCGTAALFSYSKIGGVLAIVVGYALKKKTMTSERNKIVMELQAELEIIEEKIQDAKGDNNREAKYAMMRTKTEIQSAIDKINYGLEADAKSTATAKNLISRVKGGR